MNIYLLKNDNPDDFYYYDAMVVCAASEEDARTMHPEIGAWEGDSPYDGWCPAKDVKVTYIGTAAEGMGAGLVLSSLIGDY